MRVKKRDRDVEKHKHRDTYRINIQNQMGPKNERMKKEPAGNIHQSKLNKFSSDWECVCVWVYQMMYTRLYLEWKTGIHMQSIQSQTWNTSIGCQCNRRHRHRQLCCCRRCFDCSDLVSVATSVFILI